MKKFLIALTALLIASGQAAESQVDFRIDTDPTNLQGKTSFNLTTTTAIPDDAENHAIIFTPEMSFHTNQCIDFSITTGHRHRWKSWVLGHTLFFDRSNLEGIALDQIGTGVDLQTTRFDFRANYYHPITNLKFSAIQPSRWTDAEIFFKTPYFGVGTGPLYNLDTKTWALHSRLVVPIKDVTLNLGALCGAGEYATTQAMFSISFHLFKPKKPDALISPPCHVHKASLYYNSGYSIENASFDDLYSGKIKLEYNPKIVSYIEQNEDEVTFQDKRKREE